MSLFHTNYIFDLSANMWYIFTNLYSYSESSPSAKNVNERDFLFPEANFSNLPGGLDEVTMAVLCVHWPGPVSEVPLRVKSLRQVNGAGVRGVSDGFVSAAANCWFNKVFEPIIKIARIIAQNYIIITIILLK